MKTESIRHQTPSRQELVAGLLDEARGSEQRAGGVSTPATPDAALARTLLLLRKQRGQTQEDLAHAAGLTVTAYARIERGTANATWATVRRIARALEVTLGELGEEVERQDHPLL